MGLAVCLLAAAAGAAPDAGSDAAAPGVADRDGTGRQASARALGTSLFKVDGNGNVRADGAFHAGGADFAEWLPADVGQALGPGDVLAVGPHGGLVKASRPDCTAYAGVCATKPGLLGGAPDFERGTALTDQRSGGEAQRSAQRELPAQGGPAGAGALQNSVLKTQSGARASSRAPRSADRLRAATGVAVALSGIVPVKVTAANGSIQPGTLLALSEQPGVAARATPVTLGGKVLYLPGSIIGRALESLAAGEGIIRVRLVRP